MSMDPPPFGPPTFEEIHEAFELIRLRSKPKIAAAVAEAGEDADAHAITVEIMAAEVRGTFATVFDGEGDGE